jgi:hypothetical protein
VRCVRILLVKDAVNEKKESRRDAQVTVWDADALEKGLLVSGKTYMVSIRAPLTHDSLPGVLIDAWITTEAHPCLQVTNLVPRMPKNWVKAGVKGEVYLVTRRDTRWKKVATARR